jgi:16S rRNA (cytidine1402-2'-O)-methyltransferase
MTGPDESEPQSRTGTLYLVSTPIGNLGDLSVRGARILGEVDAVLAEDTRRTSTLLNHLDISVPLRSLHAHNEEARVGEVLRRLNAGESLALVSDAGTPLVSDPGERLVARVIDAGHQVVPIPGPSAILHALVGSGLPTVPFSFLGFVPRKGRERTELLHRVSSAEETTVLFESPERIARLLGDLEKSCGGDRRAVVARELTKVHEEFRRGTLRELAGYYGMQGSPRGEVTVVVAPPARDHAAEKVHSEAARALAGALLAGGSSPSRAARELSTRLGIARNRAYAIVQDVAGEGDPVSKGPNDPQASDEEAQNQ